MIGFILEQFKVQVMKAASVGEAMEAIAKSEPNVLISDIEMPDEDGYALIKRLSTPETEQKTKNPAIALTAFARDEERIRAIQA
ncbi:MAG: response regulator [Microcoleus sp. SIO2G3]|nr:response regulator [Microcoleus sp. SIO2G3]